MPGWTEALNAPALCQPYTWGKDRASWRTEPNLKHSSQSGWNRGGPEEASGFWVVPSGPLPLSLSAWAHAYGWDSGGEAADTACRELLLPTAHRGPMGGRGAQQPSPNSPLTVDPSDPP